MVNQSSRAPHPPLSTTAIGNRRWILGVSCQGPTRKGAGGMAAVAWGGGYDAEDAMAPIAAATDGDALIAAATDGDAAAVLAALTAGASPDSLLDANTALMLAADGGHVAALVALVNAGARLDIQVLGTTALMHAADGGHEEAVAALLAAGASMELVDSGGCTALMYTLNPHP